ncbi:MAG: hypothetical protein AAGC72_11700 [Planctomycetota bacterium]
MASETVYNSFQYACREEEERYTELINRGKIYLSICTFFLGGIGFKLSSDISEASLGMQVPFMVSAFFFIMSFLLIIIALGIYKYEATFDAELIIEEFGDEPPKDGDFLDQRIADITASLGHNIAINNKRGRFLFYASFGMLAGVVSAFSGLIYLMF